MGSCAGCAVDLSSLFAGDFDFVCDKTVPWLHYSKSSGLWAGICRSSSSLLLLLPTSLTHASQNSYCIVRADPLWGCRCHASRWNRLPRVCRALGRRASRCFDGCLTKSAIVHLCFAAYTFSRQVIFRRNARLYRRRVLSCVCLARWHSRWIGLLAGW